MAENTGPAEMLIAYDPVLKRPGCAILAAGLGANTQLCHLFESDTWLTYPTPDMGVFHVTSDQLRQLVTITNVEKKKHSLMNCPDDCTCRGSYR